MKNIRLGFKLVSVGALLILVPLAVLAFLAVTRSGASLSRLGKQQLLDRSREIARIIDRVFLEESRLSLNLANDPDIIQGTLDVDTKGVEKSADIVNEIYRKLSPFERNPEIHWTYEAAIVADWNGRVFAASTVAWQGMSIAGAPYFTRALSGTRNIGEVFFSKITNMPVVPIATPIFTANSSQVVGVYVTLINIGFLTEIISAEKIGKTGYAFVVDNKGEMIAHPKPQYILKLNLLQDPGTKELGKQMTEGDSAIVPYVFEGLPVQAGIAPVETTGWSVAICMYAADDVYVNTAGSLRNLFLIISGASLVLAFFIYVLFSRSITVPLSRGVAFAQA
ncbi:MAG TPA: cache domain-containing protein, partial [Spirochaetia bacterium]|nr:cache domain-containing protein [Spirochaetia bacterium]